MGRADFDTEPATHAFRFLYGYRQGLLLISAAAQVLAGDDSYRSILAGLLADSAAHALGIVHYPGFAVDHFKKGVRAVNHALEAPCAFFLIDYYRHQITSLNSLKQTGFPQFGDQTDHLCFSLTGKHFRLFLMLRSEYFNYPGI